MTAEQARRFEFVRCLGRGSFGEVYHARMHGTGGLTTEVAVKVLRRDVAPSSQPVQRLRDEGQLLARLNHPNILRVHDMVVLEGRVGLVTELVEGEDLSTLFYATPSLSLKALLEVMTQVAGALEMAWTAPIEDTGGALNLIHRDVKPANVRVGLHGEVKLLDFGIASASTVGREAQTATGVLLGSPAYMAPERFLGGKLGVAGDAFSLGATLYEGLVRERWYGERRLPSIAGLSANQERYEAFAAERLEKLAASFPQEIVNLFADLLAYAPEQRPVLSDLVQRLESLTDIAPGVPLARWCRQREWMDATTSSGEFDTRSIAEGTSAPARRASSASKGGRLRWWLMGLASMALLMAVCMGLGWGSSELGRALLGQEVADVTVVEEVDPAPSQEPEVEAAPAAEPEPPSVEERTRPRVAPRPTPVEEPAPEPVVEAAAPVATGRAGLDVRTDVPVVFDGPAGRVVASPGEVIEVAVGTYTVEGKFGDRVDRSLVIEVVDDGLVTVRCLGRFGSCGVAE